MCSDNAIPGGQTTPASRYSSHKRRSLARAAAQSRAPSTRQPSSRSAAAAHAVIDGEISITLPSSSPRTSSSHMERPQTSKHTFSRSTSSGNTERRAHLRAALFVHFHRHFLSAPRRGDLHCCAVNKHCSGAQELLESSCCTRVHHCGKARRDCGEYRRPLETYKGTECSWYEHRKTGRERRGASLARGLVICTSTNNGGKPWSKSGLSSAAPACRLPMSHSELAARTSSPKCFPLKKRTGSAAQQNCTPCRNRKQAAANV